MSTSCSICQKKLPTNRRKGHVLELHIKKKRFFCSICGLGTHHKTNLRSHFKLHRSSAHEIHEIPTESISHELNYWIGVCFGKAEPREKAEFSKFDSYQKDYDQLVARHPKIRLYLLAKEAKQCKVCGPREWKNQITSEEHIFQEHFSKEVYSCSLCSLSSKSRARIQKHVGKQHNGEAELIKLDEKDYQPELYDWIFKCFDGTESPSSSQPKQELGREEIKENQALEVTEVKKDETSYCNLCEQEIRSDYDKYHVKYTHLKLKCFSCSICGKENFLRSCAKTHRKRKHNGEGDIIQLDESEYAEEISLWKRICFGKVKEEPQWN